MKKLTVSSGLGRVKTAVVSAKIILLEPLPYRHPQAYHPRADDGGIHPAQLLELYLPSSSPAGRHHNSNIHLGTMQRLLCFSLRRCGKNPGRSIPEAEIAGLFLQIPCGFVSAAATIDWQNPAKRLFETCGNSQALLLAEFGQGQEFSPQFP
jgi:hypothetical protein